MVRNGNWLTQGVTVTILRYRVVETFLESPLFKTIPKENTEYLQSQRLKAK